MVFPLALLLDILTVLYLWKQINTEHVEHCSQEKQDEQCETTALMNFQYLKQLSRGEECTSFLLLLNVKTALFSYNLKTTVSSKQKKKRRNGLDKKDKG